MLSSRVKGCKRGGRAGVTMAASFGFRIRDGRLAWSTTRLSTGPARSRRTAKSDAKGSGPCFRSKVEQNGDASSPKNGPDPDFAVLLRRGRGFLQPATKAVILTVVEPWRIGGVPRRSGRQRGSRQAEFITLGPRRFAMSRVLLSIGVLLATAAGVAADELTVLPDRFEGAAPREMLHRYLTGLISAAIDRRDAKYEKLKTGAGVGRLSAPRAAVLPGAARRVAAADAAVSPGSSAARLATAIGSKR